jgi:hypothetical protein
MGGSFWFEKMELGWSIELCDRNEPNGVLCVWPNLWLVGVIGTRGVQCCAGVCVCLTILGVDGIGIAGLVCAMKGFGVYAIAERACGEYKLVVANLVVKVFMVGC